jgi:hypothetical protein
VLLSKDIYTFFFDKRRVLLHSKAMSRDRLRIQAYWENKGTAPAINNTAGRHIGFMVYHFS